MPKKKDTNTPPKKRGRPKKIKLVTRVAMVIDRSGSMGSMREAAFTGINEQINVLKLNAKKGGETFVDYLQFDDVIQTLWSERPAKELQPLQPHEYQPRGSTAYLDATYRAIQNLQKADDTPDTAYLVIVISDGLENASREIKAPQLAAKIKELEATGRWTFTYMLAGQDPLKFAQAMGVNAGNVGTFTATAAGVNTAFTSMVNSSAQYMASRGSGMTQTKGFYNNPVDDTTNLGVLVPLVSGSTK